jgi:hypothetical protein
MLSLFALIVTAVHLAAHLPPVALVGQAGKRKIGRSNPPSAYNR